MKASDHVVLRYLERVRGIDVEAVRADIEGLFESATMQGVAEWTHGASFRVDLNGLVFCCRGNVVTTCYPKRRCEKRRHDGRTAGRSQ